MNVCSKGPHLFGAVFREPSLLQQVQFPGHTKVFLTFKPFGLEYPAGFGIIPRDCCSLYGTSPTWGISWNTTVVAGWILFDQTARCRQSCNCPPWIQRLRNGWVFNILQIKVSTHLHLKWTADTMFSTCFLHGQLHWHPIVKDFHHHAEASQQRTWQIRTSTTPTSTLSCIAIQWFLLRPIPRNSERHSEDLRKVMGRTSALSLCLSWSGSWNKKRSRLGHN